MVQGEASSPFGTGRIMDALQHVLGDGFCSPLDREYQLAPLVIPSSKKSPQFQPLCIQLWAYE